ncbi:acyltransferase family protein [Bacillus sp. ISL-35]|uniref:acyltransferase family protein n=1 Tax=Bacillus sp. ISL-35 TaxID=2819122 RepID=UPI001BE6B402|nr:acyltransferase family protein [Bacillus sp. ISL-35]MBT2677398.1 acyltransferase family protein [Bacillus sp. ISL-35]MBT2702214.1 acyltransferase family protein [Chryseobacterium sp. ISL-80]
MEEETVAIRHHYLDWIKVLAMMVVFLYHCSMFFNSFDWHIKNNTINHTYIEFFSLLAGNWIMPIFFVLSGMSAYYALKRRNSKSFMKERLLRLGIPLLFGVFLLSPPQVYIERITNHQFKGSFIKFIPHYFDGLYLEIGGTGNFAFFGHHLWYLLMLLLFSGITLPFFLKARREAERKEFSILQYLLIPIALSIAALTVNSIVNLGSWGIIFYLLLFISGFYFFARITLRQFVRKTGLLAGALSILFTAVYLSWVIFYGFPMVPGVSWAIFMIVRVLLVWNTLFFILFLGDKYLNFSNSILKYASEASMPFYVLHQPMIILIGYFIYSIDWPIPLKVIVLVSSSFALIMCIYHFIIKRVNFLRLLFGLKVIEIRRETTETIKL